MVAQIGFGVAVMLLMLGGLVTVTATVPVAEHEPKVDVKPYVPVLAALSAGMLGFCALEVKPFGPVHEKRVPTSVVPVRFKV